MESAGNWFDLICWATILIMSLLAFLKGFISESLSLIKLIIATILTYAISPHILHFLNGEDYSTITSLVTQTIVFIMLWIIASIFASRIKKATKNFVPKSVDQSLGFALGFTKAYLIISIIFSAVTTIYSSDLFLFHNQGNDKSKRKGPVWLQESKSYKILEIGADFVQPFTDKAMNSLKSDDLIKKIDTTKNIDFNNINKIKKFSDDYEKRINRDFTIEVEESEKNKGYQQKEIDKKNRLLDIIN